MQVQFFYQQTSATGKTTGIQLKIFTEAPYTASSTLYDDYLQISFSSNLPLALDQKQTDVQLEDFCSREEMEFLQEYSAAEEEKCIPKLPNPDSVQNIGDVISKVHKRTQKTQKAYVQPRIGFLALEPASFDVQGQTFLIQQPPI